MIAWGRTILFRAVFYGLSVLIVGMVPISALFGQRAIIAHATIWTRVHRWLVRLILGIRIRIEGERPATPALYAAKHQAMFETLELQSLLDGPAMVLKHAWPLIAREGRTVVAVRVLAAMVTSAGSRR